MRSSRSRASPNDVIEKDHQPTSPIASNVGGVINQDMSELERARLENIRRNEQFLSELGVAGVRNSLIGEVKKPSKPAKSSRSTKASLAAPPQPVRRSSRVTVDKLSAEIRQLKDEGKEEEANAKQLELDEKLAVQMNGAYVVEASATSSSDSHQRFSSDPIPMTELQNEDDNDRRISMVKELITAFGSTGCKQESSNRTKVKASHASGNNNPFRDSSASGFVNLKNTEEGVAKLAPLRMTSVAFHPSDHKIIAAAGDKGGNIGIWDVDYQANHASTADDSSHDGIFRYRPHVSNVAKIFFSDQDYHKMFTASYDGTIRMLDLSKEAFTSAFEAPETIYDTYFSDACFLHSQPDAVLLSKADGSVGLVDFRSSSSSYVWSYEVQDCRLTSVQQHPTNEHILITAGSKDGGIAIHDIRKAGKGWKPINYMTLHSKSINAAYASPDGNYIVSVSQDDTIRTWRNFLGNSSSIECSVLRHNNFTGRWLSTFRPAFDPKRANTMVLGSMLQPRRLEIFNIKESSKSGKSASFELELICNLSGDYFSSVNSRNCFHPKLELVLGSNSSGKVHLFR